MRVNACETCALSGSTKRVKNEVFRADICICGESPGAEEEIQGRPFVGPSGKLLSLVLERTGFNRTEIAIVNAVQCRLRDEHKSVKSVLRNIIKPCRAHLVDDILFIKPKVIIALGEVALSQLMNKWMSISRNRGKLFWNDEFQCYIFPTYHPAMILRRGGATEKNPFWELWQKDFQVLKEIC